MMKLLKAIAVAGIALGVVGVAWRTSQPPTRSVCGTNVPVKAGEPTTDERCDETSAPTTAPAVVDGVEQQLEVLHATKTTTQRSETASNPKPKPASSSLSRASKPSTLNPQPSTRRAGIDPPQLRQLRALWVDAFGPGFKTPKEVDRLIADAKSMRLNALFVQVSRRADCYCNKAAMPRTADPAVPTGFDPLEDVIAKAHAAGIQVHAWIITTGIWNASQPFGAPEHPYLLHGLSAKGRDFWLNARQDGETKVGADSFFDPGHPDASEFIAQMYSSVVANYAVDGVQFDRVRYPDSGDPNFNPVWGYNPTSLERFLKEAKRTSLPAPTDAAWVQWRRDQVTNLVRRVYLEVKAIRPEIWVSAATITYKEAPSTLEQFENTRTYREVLQDWPAWMQEGIVDLNIPMNYKRDREPDQLKWFDGWNKFAVQTKASGLVAVGGAMYINPQDDSYRQLKRSLEVPGVSGWVGYSYRTPDTEVYAGKRASSDAIKQFSDRVVATGGPFGSSAGWGIPSPPSGALGRVIQGGVGVAAVTLEIGNTTGETRRVQSDANGYFGAKLPPGEWTVKTLEASSASTFTVTAGRVVRLPDLELP